ncbi:uncharacterized protein LOC18770052 isoform X1 [Prunus persica]|uniref:uncharacterized protein LOC18770052 isoform X1 n=1 Tax=Prunus persica TaxID=3760 RepID=UPI0009AB6B48|nr:uncharacterized protein LOC18770052 isoform X1 [Prunus persica]
MVIDLIEEDAINEKCCIQVLKILITKADTEIDELEKDLVALQSELAWAEHEEWSEICGSALREKIVWLDISTRNLRSIDENNNDIQLLMHREPADNIHDIVKALLRTYFPEKDEQRTPEVIALNSSSDSSLHDTGLLDGHKDLNKSDSHSVVKEERGEIGITKGERCTSTTLKFQEKKTNDSKTIKPANTNIMDSSPDSLRLAADYYDKKKTSSKSNSKSTQQWEAKGQGLTCEENKTSTMMFKNEKPANTNIMYSSPDSLRLAAGYSDKKKILDSEHARQWVAEGQDLAPVEKKASTVTFNSQQPANIDVMNLSSDSLRLAAGYCDKKKTTYSESTTHWEPKGQGLAPDEKKIIQDASMFHKERSMQNLEVEHATIKDSSTSISCPDENDILNFVYSESIDEKVDEYSSIPMADITGSLSRPDGFGRDFGKTVEFQIELPEDASVKYFSSDSLKYANGCSSGMKNSCLPLLVENGYEEVRKQPSTSTDKNQMLSLSLNPESTLEKTEKHIAMKNSSTSVICPEEKIKLKISDSVIMNEMVEEHASMPVADNIGPSLRPDGPGTDVKLVELVTKETSSTSVSCPDEKNKLKNSDSKIMSEKVGEHTSIPMVNIVGSSRRDKCGTDVDRTVESADGVVKYFSSDSLKYAKGWSNEMKNSRLIEKGYEEGGKATHQKIEKEPANALVKYMSPNSWRQSAGINKRTESSESRLCASRQGKNEKSDVEQKLIDFVPKTAQKVGIKESKVILANKTVCSNTCLKAAGDVSNNLQIVKFQEGGLTDLGHFALPSKDQMGEDTAKPKLNDVGKPAEESQKANADLHKKPRVNLGLEPQKPKTQRKSPFSMKNAQEPSFPPTDTSFIPHSKKERKSIIDDDNTSLKQFLSLMHLKKSVHTTKVSASQSQKKRKRTSTLSLTAEVKDLPVDLGLQDSHKDATDGGSKKDLQIVVYEKTEDLHIIEPYSVEDGSYTGALVPHTISSLKNKKIVELRKLAQKIKLTGYYKLRKEALVEKIAKKLGC